MKSQYNLVLLLFEILLLSCHYKPQIQQTELQTINIVDAESNRLTDEDVLNALHFVPLETTENCLIGAISQIEMYENRFYILDKKDKLWVFNDKGKFITRIGSQGPGPEEYTGATYFYIHPTKKYICLLDMATGGSAYYTLNGEYVKRNRMKIDFRTIIVTGIQLLDDEHVLFQSTNSFRYKYNYLVVNENDLSSKLFQFPYLVLGEENSGFPFNRNCNSGKIFYAMSHLSDTIYRWNKDKFVAELILESGLKHPTSDILSKLGPYDFYDQAEVELNSMGYSKGINRLCSTDDYLYLQYFGLGYYDAVFWDLTNKERYLYRFKGADNPLLHIYNDLMSTSQKSLIRYMVTDMFSFAEKEIKACNHPEVTDLYKNMKEDDNPVLLLYDYDKLIKSKVR